MSRLISECLPLSHYADVQRGITPMNLHASPEIPNARKAFTGTVRRYSLSAGELRYVRFNDTLAEPKPERYFEGPRILLRELISRQFRLQAMLTTEPFVTNKSMQSILLRTDEAKLKFILACLNSKLMSWFFLHRSNVGQRDDFPKIVLKETRSLPLPELTAGNRATAKQLAIAAGRLLDISRERSNSPEGPRKAALERQLENTERQIDSLVYKMYGLSEQEIKIVEDAEDLREVPTA